MTKVELASLHAIVHGRVQGVMFRDFTQRRAAALGLTGYVRNMPDGTSVEVMAEGERTLLERLLEHVKKGPRAARVDRVDVEWSEYADRFNDFDVMF